MPGIDTYTKLLLHCDGSDASTTFTDSETTPKTMTAVGNAQIDTAQSKFGGASGLFDGTGDRVTAADHADWNFAAGDFTIDLWVRWNAVGGTQSLISQYSATGNQRNWLFYHDGTNLQFLYSTNGTSGTAAGARAWSPSNGVWYHVAVVRTGDVCRYFIDGTQLGADAAITGTLFDSTALMVVGDYADTGFGFNGWLDEVRISKGIARWTTNFTPPTAAYSADVSVAAAIAAASAAAGAPVPALAIQAALAAATAAGLAPTIQTGLVVNAVVAAATAAGIPPAAALAALAAVAQAAAAGGSPTPALTVTAATAEAAAAANIAVLVLEAAAYNFGAFVDDRGRRWPETDPSNVFPLFGKE